MTETANRTGASPAPPGFLSGFPRVFVLATALWTLVVGTSLAWNLAHDRRQTMNQAYAEARANLNKDITFRRWGTKHGGVYVPVTETQKSIPWLAHIPGRDVTTTDGRTLTLINPASMMRQVMDDYSAEFGIRGRITGLRYLNPANAPDAWEKEQLESFTRGEKKEVWAITDLDGRPHLRYLRAMYMEPGCDKCHAILGYKAGDMRGATGLSLPLAAYYRQIDESIFARGFSHGGIWLLGLLGIGWASRSVRQREAELRSERDRSQTYLDTVQSIMVALDRKGCVTMINPFGCKLLGYRAEDLLGRNWFETCVPQTEKDEILRPYFKKLIADGSESREYMENRLRTASGKEVLVAWRNAALRDPAGRIVGTLSAGDDITERRATEEEVHSLAFFDPLTGLPNRRLLVDRLRQSMATSARSGKTHALLYLDLDRFKNLNDTLGHDVGDRLLVETARRLRTCVREGDTVARLGGDEFVLLLEQLSADSEEAAMQAGAVAEKIIGRVGEAYDLGGEPYRGTTSVGITLFVGQEANVDELLKRADLAMYQAKAAGRNALRFFDPAMQAAIAARAAIESELRRAVVNHEFVLHYQPQVDADGECIGVEALLRWHNPGRGMVPPMEFIPLAEETGLILQIGHWVISEACARLREWQHDPRTADLSIAVNVSARQFREGNFVDEVQALLGRFAIDPGLLKLEITESMLVEDVDEVVRKMTVLKGLGLHFSLDDFGTGYSSLTYVKRLPLDQLKIDQSFVRDVLIDQNDAAICRAIIALGDTLGLHTIAEGVETTQQWDFLARAGCNAGQGYLYAKPMPVGELLSWIRHRARPA